MLILTNAALQLTGPSAGCRQKLLPAYQKQNKPLTPELTRQLSTWYIVRGYADSGGWGSGRPITERTLCRRAFEISHTAAAAAAAEQSDSAAPGGRPHHSRSHMFPER